MAISSSVHETYLSNKVAVLVLGVALFSTPVLGAQDVESLKEETQVWLDQSSHAFSHGELLASYDDLRPLEEMIGAARIVAISESNHGAREAMLFRNRVFRFLVEELGFEAIALESGVVESKELIDYVATGDGNLDTLLERGVTNGFNGLQQNRELVEWVRDYNLQLPQDAKKLQIFGFDVSGSPYHNAAARNPDTSIRTALAYLRTVDADVATDFTARFERFLPALADIFDYGKLTVAERNALTSSIADLVAEMERSKFQFQAASSESEYAWGAHAAVAARQIDTWFRQIPLDWEPSDGFAWNEESQKHRDRAMMENLDWIVERLGPSGRLVVFASVGHIATTQMYLAEDETRALRVPFGWYARSKYQDDFVNVLNLTVGGEVEICHEPASERVPRVLSPPPELSAEAMFTQPAKESYFVDLRRAPAPVANWLTQDKQHWNGFGAWVFPTLPAFDVASYTGSATADCVD